MQVVNSQCLFYIVEKKVSLRAQGYLVRKSFARNFFKFVHQSLFIITKMFLVSESLNLFKLNKLMFAIVMKHFPGDHESSLNIFIYKLSLPRCPCASNVGVYCLWFEIYKILRYWSTLKWNLHFSQLWYIDFDDAIFFSVFMNNEYTSL